MRTQGVTHGTRESIESHVGVEKGHRLLKSRAARRSNGTELQECAASLILVFCFGPYKDCLFDRDRTARQSTPIDFYP